MMLLQCNILKGSQWAIALTSARANLTDIHKESRPGSIAPRPQRPTAGNRGRLPLYGLSKRLLRTLGGSFGHQYLLHCSFVSRF